MTVSSLSVIMPNYNHAHYIGEALQAILDQGRRPEEVIVIDDGSTDDSVSLIEQFSIRDPIVCLVRNSRNRGALFSANRALNMASGDYVFFAAADDKVLPGFFEKSMNLLAQYPYAGLCCSDPASLDSRTGILSENRLHWSDKPCYFWPQELARVIKGGYIAGHTSILKRSAVLEAGGMIPELGWHCDWFTSLVMGFRYGICYIPESLATLRVLPNSFSASGRRNWALQREILSHLLRLLKSASYRDVLPLFIRGNVMSHFGSEIVRLVLSNPQHWDYHSWSLIRRPLWQEIRHRAGSFIPFPIKWLYRRIRDRRRRMLTDSLLLL